MRTCTPPRIHTSLHSIAFICSYGYIKKYVVRGGNLSEAFSPFLLPRSGSWEQNVFFCFFFLPLFHSPKYGSVHCKVTLSVNSVQHSRLSFGCHVRLSSLSPRPWMQQKLCSPYHSQPSWQIPMLVLKAAESGLQGWEKSSCSILRVGILEETKEQKKKKSSWIVMSRSFQCLMFPGSSVDVPIYEGSRWWTERFRFSPPTCMRIWLLRCGFVAPIFIIFPVPLLLHQSSNTTTLTPVPYLTSVSGVPPCGFLECLLMFENDSDPSWTGSYCEQDLGFRRSGRP